MVELSVSVPLEFQTGGKLMSWLSISIDEALNNAIERIYWSCLDLIPVKTGALRASFKVERVGKRLEMSWTAPHAHYADEGVDLHMIRPKRAKRLRWFDETGKIHFAKEVEHPGYPGRDYAEKVRKRAREILTEELRYTLSKNRQMVEV